jgi:hypothetical protein
VGAEFALVLAFVFGLAVTVTQFGSLAITALKIQHAAQEAAYVAGSTPAAGGHEAACWAVSGGMRHPDPLDDAAVCRTVVENLGNLDIDRTTMSVRRGPSAAHPNSPVYLVSITYREQITSPLVRLLLGPTFTATAEASSY